MDSDPSEYDIFWTPKEDKLSQERLTPATWIQLLSSGAVENGIFVLSPKYRRNRYKDERAGGSHSGSYNYNRDIVRDESHKPLIPFDHPQNRIQRRDADFSSRPLNDLSASRPFTSGRMEYRPDHGSESDQSASDEGSAEDSSSENSNGERRSSPIGPGRAQPKPESPVATIPYDPQRLLTWPDDPVRKGNSGSVELGDRVSVTGSSDNNLDEGTRQIQRQPGPAYAADADDDGIRIVPQSDTERSKDSDSGQSSKAHVFKGPPRRSPYRWKPDNVSETASEDTQTDTERRKRYRKGNSRMDRTKEDQEAVPKSSGLINFPFFTWRVKYGTEEQAGLLSVQERDETVVRILAKINESITSEDSSYRALYVKAYRCTSEYLLRRHPDVKAEGRADEYPEKNDASGHANPADDLPTDLKQGHNKTKEQHATENQDGTERQDSDGEGPTGAPGSEHDDPQAGKDGTAQQSEDSANANSDRMAPVGSDRASSSGLGGEPLKAQTERDAKNDSRAPGAVIRADQVPVLQKELLEVSQSIFRAFLPSQGGSPIYDYYHPLCARFWGSVDEIFRVSSGYLR